uniref:Phosphoglycerate mutase n=1 Tax=Globisporangium ultimum (strain ATCC 200006 / CBS 805.95 / DAOM BR144) TaxID=431595 RepID=K3WUE1_GLOUD
MKAEIFALDGFFTRVNPDDIESVNSNHTSIFKNFRLAVGSWADLEAKLAKTKNHMTPARDIKVVYLIRHAQGAHNVAEVEYGDAWWTAPIARSDVYLDTNLTELGINDARSKGPPGLAAECDKGMPRIERVIVSTLSRTIQTAHHFFEGYPMVSPRFVSMELCREKLGIHTFNKRVSRTKLQEKFSKDKVDFSRIRDEEDTLWSPTHMETESEIQERAQEFLRELFASFPEETHVAVVTHYKVIWAIFKVMYPHFEKDVAATNCEVIPIVLERVQ